MIAATWLQVILQNRPPGQLCEWQAHAATVRDAPRDSLGEFHILHAVLKRSARHRFQTANGVDELLFYPPVTGLIVRNSYAPLESVVVAPYPWKFSSRG